MSASVGDMVDTPVVVVRGEAVREVPPELAVFSVTVAARGKDRQAVLARLTERSGAVLALLDSYGDAVERRETGGMHVRPELKRSGERVGAYAASVSTTVTVTDFTVLGELMLRLADQDQTTVAGPWWQLRPGSDAGRETRRAAIDEAVARAREYADAVGARLQRLLEISDEAGTTAVPMSASAFGVAEEAGVLQLDLDPPMQTVRAEVLVRFTISEPTALG